MDILYIVVPAYNEEMNIERLVRDWYPVVLAHDGGGLSRLVVVNDGSTDSTWDRLNALVPGHPLLVPVTKPNGGHGSAVIFGYRFALEHGADYVFQTDSDGQTDPAEFEAFWKRRRRYDAVFGSRQQRGDGAARAFVEKVLCMILRLYFGVMVPDANAPYRLMSFAYLREYLPRMSDDYELPNVMLTIFGARDRRRICFIPITFGARRGGRNSLNAKKIVKTGLRALRDFRRFRRSC